MLDFIHNFSFLTKKSDLKILYVICIFHALAFSFISITFPLYLLELGGSALIVGVASATFGFMKLLSSFFGGYFSDFTGKIKTLKISLILFVISGLTYFFSYNYSFLLIGKLFQGIAGGLFWTSIISLVEKSSSSYKARSIGLVESFRSIASLLIILFSGFIITHFSLKITLLLFSFIFIFNFLFTSITLKKKEKIKTTQINLSFSKIKKIINSFFIEKKGKYLFPIYFAFGFFMGFEDFLPLYGLELDMSYIEISILKIMTLTGLIFIPYISGFFSDKINRYYPIILGNFLSLITLVLLFFITTKTIVFFLFFFLSLFIFIPYPSLVAVVNEDIKETQSGKFNGIIISIKMLGVIVSSLLNGVLFHLFSYNFVFFFLIIVFSISFFSSILLFINK